MHTTFLLHRWKKQSEINYNKKEFIMNTKFNNNLVLAVVSALLLLGCGSDKKENKEEKKIIRPAGIVTLSPTAVKEIGLHVELTVLKPFTGYISIPAKVLADQDNEAQVGSLVQGRVYKVFVKAGDYVKAGQELMQVEGLQIGEIKAGFLKAKAALEYQKANYERQRTLNEQKIGSQKSLLEAQAEFEKAKAEFNAEDRKIHSVGLNDVDILNGRNGHADEHTSGTLPVKSPINGIVAERNVVVGQLVDGNTTAFKLVNTGSVWVDGQIYERDLYKIPAKAEITFSSSANPAEIFKGRLSYIGQTIDEKSRTITVRGEFPNAQGKMKPQMFGNMKIQAGKNSMALLVPAESIMKIENTDVVFIQKNDTTFEKRAVIPGAVQDDLVEIKEGLMENERIVIKAAFYLKSELLKEALGEGE